MKHRYSTAADKIRSFLKRKKSNRRKFIHTLHVTIICMEYIRKQNNGVMLKIVYDINVKNTYCNVPVHSGRVCTKRINVIRCVKPICMYACITYESD